MLKVENLVKEFGSDGGTVRAVDDVSLEVDTGSFVSIIGKSGSGKSTLLSLLGALEQPTNGSVEVDGKDIAAMNERSLMDYRCRKIGFIFQNYNLIPNLSALENVVLPMEFAKIKKSERVPRARKLLGLVGISETEMLRKPGKLSGGQQQRVSIARALANSPKIILADEPTGNLDSQTGKVVFDLLHSLSRSEDTTIITVTHDLSIAGKTDMTFTLKDGKLMTK